jgi:hypothetical protein
MGVYIPLKLVLSSNAPIPGLSFALLCSAAGHTVKACVTHAITTMIMSTTGRLPQCRLC